MNVNEVRNAIYTHFINGWQDVTPFWFDNESVEPTDEAWVRLTVRHDDTSLRSFGSHGNKTTEVRGMVYLQYFQKPDIGTKDYDLNMQRFIDSFSFKKITGTTIRFFGATNKEIGNVEDGRYWAGQGQVEFLYDVKQ